MNQLGVVDGRFGLATLASLAEADLDLVAQTLNDLDSEILRLRRIRCAVLQKQNTLLPAISKIPAELMGLIFSYCAPRPKDHGVRPSSSWISFSLVCSYWRNIAISSSPLWTMVTFLPTSVECTQTSIRRSAPMPFHLRVFLTEDYDLEKVRQMLINGVSEEDVSRLHTLDVMHGTKWLENDTEDTAHWTPEWPPFAVLPNLRTIHLSGDLPINLRAFNMGGNLPQLQHLTIDLPFEELSATLPATLQTLSIIGVDMDPSGWKPLYKILETLPVLSQLRVTGKVAWDPGASVLPSVQHLWCTASLLTAMASCISMPSLRSICLRIPLKFMPWSTQPPMTLQTLPKTFSTAGCDILRIYQGTLDHSVKHTSLFNAAKDANPMFLHVQSPPAYNVLSYVESHGGFSAVRTLRIVVEGRAQYWGTPEELQAIIDEWSELLRSCPSLEAIDIEGPRTHLVLTALEACTPSALPSLAKLRLSGLLLEANRLTGDVAEVLVSTSSKRRLAGFPLERVELHRCGGLSADTITSLSALVSTLEVVQIAEKRLEKPEYLPWEQVWGKHD